ncbi:Cwf15/Cwc15 cell cycle control protein-domain-containing protein [Gorgonomyces haynaldii]|nr:Cwf15/Cwc15 cell cycle control protein-domain-containing protein [Gorgonomyces haynaldii]
MTSAARPTFLPAMGGHTLRDTRNAPLTQVHAKDVNQHLKLKLRQKGQFTREEVKGMFKKVEITPQVIGLDKESDTEESASEEESEDDDEEELLRELEKIKQERLKEKQEKEEQELEKIQEKVLEGNPLLSLKRRWDDDVIFRNQAKNEEQPKKRFINDMLRSDFHRKFMSRFIK